MFFFFFHIAYVFSKQNLYIERDILSAFLFSFHYIRKLLIQNLSHLHNFKYNTNNEKKKKLKNIVESCLACNKQPTPHLIRSDMDVSIHFLVGVKILLRNKRFTRALGIKLVPVIVYFHPE